MSAVPSDFTILVVDDEPMMRDMIVFELKMLGYKTLTAGDGLEGLAILDQSRVDLILSDVRMPNCDGMQFLREVRQRFGTRPAFFFMSGFADVPLWDALNDGAAGWLSKPFDLEVVSKVLTKTMVEVARRWTSPLTFETSGVVNLRVFAGPVSTAGLKLGQGGLCVEVVDERLQKGKTVAFEILVDGPTTFALEGVGVVRWVRGAGDASRLPAACGIEFLYLPPQSKIEVERSLALSKPRSFIPKCA